MPEHNRQHRLPATGLGLPLVSLTVAAFTLQGSYSHSPAQSFLRARRPPGGMEHSYYSCTTPSPSCTLLPVATPSVLICWSGWSLICQWITQRDHWKSGISNGMSDVKTKIGKLNFKIKFWKIVKTKTYCIILFLLPSNVWTHAKQPFFQYSIRSNRRNANKTRSRFWFSKF